LPEHRNGHCFPGGAETARNERPANGDDRKLRFFNQPTFLMSRKDKRLLQRMRVPLGFIFAAVFLLLAQPSAVPMAIGCAIAVIGLLIRGWAAGHIRKNVALAVSGPYAYTRNPLYLGSFLLGLGFTIASGVWWLGIVFAVAYLSIYFPVMRREAEDLTGFFGDDYREYARHVPLFFPGFRGFRTENAEENRFDLNLYLKYREYRAALGLVLAWAVLAAKAVFLG
jgi:protein-S-isoprenylcysteine O-methyltransferase Ste14